MCRCDTSHVRNIVATSPRVLYIRKHRRETFVTSVSRAAKNQAEETTEREGETQRNNGHGVFRTEPFVTPRPSLSRRVKREESEVEEEERRECIFEERERERESLHKTNRPPIWSKANTGNGLYSLIGSLLMYSVLRSLHLPPPHEKKLARLVLRSCFLSLSRTALDFFPQFVLSREKSLVSAATGNYKSVAKSRLEVYFRTRRNMTRTVLK